MLTVTANQDIVLRGDQHHQTTTPLRGLLYEGPGSLPYGSPNYGDQFGGSNVEQHAQPQSGLKLVSWELHNRAAAAISVGIGFRWKTQAYRVGDWDNSETIRFTPRDGFKSRTATTVFGSIGTPAVEDGICIVSRRKWDWMSMNVTTASTDGDTSNDFDVDYSNNASSGWVTQTALQSLVDSFTTANGELTAGEHILAWYPPHDWSPVTQGSVLAAQGISVGHYAVILRWAEVPDTTDPIITGLEVGSMTLSGEELADNGLFENEISSYIDFDGDGVVAMFETAAPGNMVKFEVTHAG